MRKLYDILRKSIAISAVFSLLMLNLAAVIPCGQMIVNDGCCHVTNSVMPCCVKNLKITADERLTGHCGCSIKELQQPADMYFEFTQSHKNYSQTVSDFEAGYSKVFFVQNTAVQSNHSPPIISGNSLYILNLSLRI